MGDEFLAACPRTPPQVAVTERVVEQLGLIQPGGMGRCEPGTPPPATGSAVPGRPGGVTRVAVLDQVHAPQLAVAPTESPSTLRCNEPRPWSRRTPHASARWWTTRNDRRLDGAAVHVLDPPADRAGDRAADWVAPQDLMVGHLVGADHPIAPPGQPDGVGVAPEDLLGPLLEQRVQPGRPPVASPVGLQIDVVQDQTDRPRRWPVRCRP